MKTLIIFIFTIQTFSALGQSLHLEPLNADYVTVKRYKQTIAMAGTHGTLTLSTDNGTTWQQSFVTDKDNIFTSLTLGDDNTIILCTNYPRLYMSSNNGLSWELHITPEPFIKVIMDDSGNRIAFSQSKIYVSKNKGKEWDMILKSDNYQIRDIYQSSNKRLFAVTNQGLMQSIGNGITIIGWELLHSHQTFTYYSPIHETADGTFYYMVDDSVHRGSPDAQQWKSMHVQHSLGLIIGKSESFFRLLQRVELVSSNSYYRILTIDAITEKVVDTLLFDSVFMINSPSLYSQGTPKELRCATRFPVLLSFDASNTDSIIIVGFDKTIYSMSSTGVCKQISLFSSFQSKASNNLQVTKQGFNYVTPYDKGLYTHNNNMFYRSVNHGVTWLPPHKNLDVMRYGFDGRKLIVLENNIYSALNSSIFYSTDKGESFQSGTLVMENKQSSIVDCSVFVADSSTLTLTAYMQNIATQEIHQGLIAESKDKGKTWNQIHFFDSMVILKTIQFEDSWIASVKYPDSTGVVDGKYAIIINGGSGLMKMDKDMKHYSIEKMPDTINSIDDIVFTDTLHAIASIRKYIPEKYDYINTLQSTSDGGKTWSMINDDEKNGFINIVQSKDKNVVWVFLNLIGNTSTSKILKSSDFGKTWHTFTVPKVQALFSNSSDTIFLSNYESQIYRATEKNITGIIEENNNWRTSVWLDSPYPNPTSGTTRFQISWYDKTVDPKTISLILYNLSGDKVMDCTAAMSLPQNGGSAMIDLDIKSLPAGVYILSSKSSNREGNSRIVVKN